MLHGKESTGVGASAHGADFSSSFSYPLPCAFTVRVPDEA